MIKLELIIEEKEEFLKTRDFKGSKVDVSINKIGIKETEDEERICEILEERITLGRETQIIDETKEQKFKKIAELINSL